VALIFADCGPHVNTPSWPMFSRTFSVCLKTLPAYNPSRRVIQQRLLYIQDGCLLIIFEKLHTGSCCVKIEASLRETCTTAVPHTSGYPKQLILRSRPTYRHSALFTYFSRRVRTGYSWLQPSGSFIRKHALPALRLHCAYETYVWRTQNLQQ
jgi:hypothetical protein